jgi:septal ring-binding cell division protein DamX
MGKKIAAVAATATLALGGAAAVASADSGTSTPTTSTPTTSAPATSAPAANAAPTKRAGHNGLLGRADHGEVEVRVKGDDGKPAWVWVTFDRGKVTAVNQGSITLARPDGQSVTLQLSPTTKYHGVTGWQQITNGKGAVVVSRSGTATQVLQRKANG